MKKYDGYALVTGGDTGIGYAIAEQLAINSYNLVLVARNGAALEKAKEHLASKYKVTVRVLIKDLAEPNAAHEVYDYVQSKNIHIALLVNNAGFGEWGALENSKYEPEINMIEVMCRSVTGLTYLFLPEMIEKGEGGIILISSFVSRIHMPCFAVYCACKAFESSFGTTLNFEVRAKNIDVLVVSPAVTKTGFYKTTLKEKVELGQSRLLGLKFNTPEKVAELAVKKLGKKIEIVTGNLLDKFFFYSTVLMPLFVQRWFMRNYLNKIYNIKY